MKKSFNSVDSVGNDRYVFKVSGNKYRIVAMIHFSTRTIYIRFVGTHKQYDKIDQERRLKISIPAAPNARRNALAPASGTPVLSTVSMITFRLSIPQASSLPPWKPFPLEKNSTVSVLLV